jgi:hypothetical protein
MKLGTDINRFSYLPEVIIEHLHPAAGKAEWDQGYKDVNAEEIYSADKKAFDDYISSVEYQNLVDYLKWEI